MFDFAFLPMMAISLQRYYKISNTAHYLCLNPTEELKHKFRNHLQNLCFYLQKPCKYLQKLCKWFNVGFGRFFPWVWEVFGQWRAGLGVPLASII